MEECAICSKKNFYDCTFCEFCRWKKFTAEPEKLSTKTILEDTKANLNFKQTDNIRNSLIRKIQIINSCSSTIISKTYVLIAKIQNLCMHSINTLKNKQQNYLRLLQITDKSVIAEEKQNIQRELKTFLVGCIPSHNFKELDDFYSFDFIKEIQKNSKFSSTKINDFKQILEEEYRLPIAATLKNERFLRGHTEGIRSLAITSDNKYIISGGFDKTVRIWNLEDNSQEAVLYGHTDAVSKILITSDCKYIISVSNDKSARIWNFANKTQEAIIAVELSHILRVEITSDSKYIAYCTSKINLVVWNFQTNLQETILQNHAQSITVISVSGNSKYITSGFIDGSIMIWSLTDKILEAAFQGRSYSVTALAITSDNKYLISCNYKDELHVWNIENKQLENVLRDYNHIINYIKIGADNKYLYYGISAYEIRVWNLQERKLERDIGHKGYRYAMVLLINDNTNIADGFHDHELIVQKISGSSKDILISCLNMYGKSVAVTSDCKYIISTSGNDIKILNFHTINEKYIFSSLGSIITSVTVSSDNRLIVFGSGSENNSPILINNTVRVWDLHEKR